MQEPNVQFDRRDLLTGAGPGVAGPGRKFWIGGVLRAVLVVLVLVPAAAQASAGTWTGDPVVRTASGQVRGFLDRESTWSWKGIPYARPPVGDLRWKAPRDPLPWSGVRAAATFGNWAPQFFPLLGFVTGSEDCLYLNVWRPVGKAAGLPVYVWIHGGGNSVGAADMVPDYYGHAVAARSDMVFVSINYRLGPLGWFYHDSLAAEADAPGALPGDGSGNYGTLDIIRALRWVRQNAAAFGGDPDRVTIAGESAGAMNILSLLTSPMAAGLFQRAVVQSGSTRMANLEDARAASAGLVAGLAVADRKAPDEIAAYGKLAAMPAAEHAAWLRGQSPARILSRTKGGATGMTGWPTIYPDGSVISAVGYDVFMTGDYPVKVPIIIGSNKEETKLFLYFDKSTDWKGELFRAVARFGSERWRLDGVDSLAAVLSSHADQPPVWVYRFDWGARNEKGWSPEPGDWGERLGAFHTLEIPFFLGTDTINGVFLTGSIFNEANRPGRQALSAGIMTYLAAFARNGDPNPIPGETDGEGRKSKSLPPNLPRWEAHDPAIMGGSDQVRGLIFDVDGAAPAFRPLTEFLTRDGLDEAMSDSLEPSLMFQVMERLGWK